MCEFAGSGIEMIYTPVISTDPYTVCVLGRSNVGNIIRYQTVRVLRIILIIGNEAGAIKLIQPLFGGKP